MDMHRNISSKSQYVREKKKNTRSHCVALSSIESSKNHREDVDRRSIFNSWKKGNKLSLVRTSFTIYHPDCFILLSDFPYYANHSYKKQRLRFDNSYKKFPCPNCPSVFVWKCTLKRHLRNECGQEPRFKCPHCDYRGKWKANICRHIKRVHKNCSIYVLDT